MILARNGASYHYLTSFQAQVQARIMAAKASMSPQSYVSQPAASDYTSYGGLPPQSASDPFRPHEVLQPTYESRFYQGQSPGTQPLQLPLHTQLPVMGAPLMPQPGHSSPFLTRSPQLPGHHDPHLPPQVQECYHPRAPSPYQPQFQDRYQPQAQDVYQPRIEDPYPYPSPECPQFETDPWDYERQGSRHAVNGQRAVRPRQDPNRVERTVFVENVPHDMNEQVSCQICTSDPPAPHFPQVAPPSLSPFPIFPFPFAPLLSPLPFPFALSPPSTAHMVVTPP